MKLTFLGTGTSYGVPYIGCECDVCLSDDARNKRLRCSILVEDDETRILVDTTPDMRAQFLRAGIKQISAVLWTHAHNDHIIGLDDLRPVSDRLGYIPGYANAETLGHLQGVFNYVFVQGREHGGFPRVTGHVRENGQSWNIGAFRITAIPIQHGQREIFAYRFEHDGKSLVYATDCSFIPESSYTLMQSADVFVVDALRHKEHPTHFSVGQALEVVQRLQPGRALFTHIAHDLDHETTNATLPKRVQLAYDTLTVEI
ncbi:MAG TPA: MBL fold metallo-hydrolase [Abditibacteriaceae bacterium]|jgi:phosphoribosyl 1,2-cyclic phosphate phosphodiesterase